MSGTTLTAVPDGRPVGSVDDSSYAAGNAGIGVVGYQTDQFDDLRITPARPVPAPARMTVTAPQQLQRGETGTVRASFTVPAGSPVADGLDLRLSGREGWSVTPAVVHVDRVAPGRTVTATWSATAPTLRDTPTDNTLTVTATYAQ